LAANFVPNQELDSRKARAEASSSFIDIINFNRRAEFVERTNHVLSVQYRYRFFSDGFSILILNPGPIGIGVSSVVFAHRLFSIPIPISKMTGGGLLNGKFPKSHEERESTVELL
jgi:hypothetical protein